MIIKATLTFRLSLFSFILTQLFANQIALADTDSNKLTRNSNSAMELTVDLTKDIYRSEPYEAEYTVEIPYQEEETYYVDVPYEETEAYTDEETYYENEYVCHTRTDYERVCRDERQCRPVHDREICEQERVCRPSQGREVCQDVEECGTNARGERICKTRRVCHTETGSEECHYEQRCRPGGSHEECSYETVCEQIPRDRQECGYEQIERTRSVTKYRTVTKYRQETRTRTVTKYRTETRCCETRYHEVFDHEASMKVSVVFPRGSELFENEQESFLIQMESETSVEIKGKSTIFGYGIKEKLIQNGTARIVLELKPKYQSHELGNETIENLSFSEKNTMGLISFSDSGRRPRVETLYSYQILEKESGQVIEQIQNLSFQTKDVQILTQAQLSPDLDYVLNLVVERKGVVLTLPITFARQIIKMKGPLDPREFSNPEDIQDLKAFHSSDDTRISIQDLSPLHSEIQTQYQIEILRKGGFLGSSWKTLVAGTFPRPQGSQISFSLTTDFKLSKEDIKKYTKAGQSLKLKIKTKRQGPRLNHGRPLFLEKEEVLRIQ